MSGPYKEEPRDDAPRPREPSQPPWQQPSPQSPQQLWQPPWQQPSQPFAAPSALQYLQPAPWPLFEPPSLRYAHRSFMSVNGLGTAVSILICLVALAQAVLAASYWYTYKVVKDYVEGPVKDPDRLDRADQVWILAVGGFLLALLAAGVVFIVWLWRARGNAELFCYGRHRRGRGWVIGGWFCPVVNFWFPKQIVDDVIAASDPRTPPLFPDLRRIPRHGLVLAWWLIWVATMVRGPGDHLGPRRRRTGRQRPSGGCERGHTWRRADSRRRRARHPSGTPGQPPADVPAVDSVVGDRSVDRATAMAGPASAANPRS